jgi:hypothetical protein
MLIAITVQATSIPMARMEWPSDLQPADNKRPLAINNVNLVTMVDEQVLMDRQLLTRDAVIERIEPAGVAVGYEYRYIDAEVTYLMPGLFVHTPARSKESTTRSR